MRYPYYKLWYQHISGVKPWLAYSASWAESNKWDQRKAAESFAVLIGARSWKQEAMKASGVSKCRNVP